MPQRRAKKRVRRTKITAGPGIGSFFSRGAKLPRGQEAKGEEAKKGSRGATVASIQKCTPHSKRQDAAMKDGSARAARLRNCERLRDQRLASAVPQDVRPSVLRRSQPHISTTTACRRFAALPLCLLAAVSLRKEDFRTRHPDQTLEQAPCVSASPRERSSGTYTTTTGVRRTLRARSAHDRRSGC